ncbi:MAG: hypothetical protein U0U25_01510 [Flavobacteriales bacterium]
MHGERTGPAEGLGRATAISGDDRSTPASATHAVSDGGWFSARLPRSLYTDLCDPELWGLCVVGALLLLFS